MEYDDKHWWKIFVDSKKNDLVINPIIKDIERAEEDPNKEKILKIGKGIDKLDPDKYSEEIRNLKKKYNILVNRIERQISDDFGTLLRFLRKKRGLSLAKLGELTGISPSYINRLELRQRKSPSINIMEKLAKALDVPLAELASAAGIEFAESDSIDIISIIRQNEISIGYNNNILENNQKEKLLRLIGFISESAWGENKKEETDKLIDLMDDFRQAIEGN